MSVLGAALVAKVKYGAGCVSGKCDLMEALGCVMRSGCYLYIQMYVRSAQVAEQYMNYDKYH